MAYADLYARDVPQSERRDARQVANNAGGFVYALSIWDRLDRFLILGSDAPTYYQAANKLTRENAAAVIACWTEDARRTAARIVEISTAGRAPKVSPAIFALALGEIHDSEGVRQIARAELRAVCRTASHLFEFVSTVGALGRGWGRGFKRAVSEWFEARPTDNLAFQMTKYRARSGLDHKRVLRLAHPAGGDKAADRVALYRWAVGRDHDASALPAIVRGHIEAMQAQTPRQLLPLIERHRLPWEAVPTWALTSPEVWAELLPNLGATALLRNLGTLSAMGLTMPMSNTLAVIVSRLQDAEQIRMGRLHPYAYLQAMAVYRSGKSVKGERTWEVSQAVVDALDAGFYLAFGNVEATGRRMLLALDVSGSMGTSFIGGVLTAREASAAMAMVTARVEKAAHFVGFSQGMVELRISPRQRLDDVVATVSGLPFQRTDCAQPMLYASSRKLEVDAFVVYTDSETWVGGVHPVDALRRYRRQIGINAKLIVVGMTSTGFSIADREDGGMLDVVGFDAAAPNVMADFVRA